MKMEEPCSGAKKFLIALIVAFILAGPAWANEKILHNFVDLPHGANPQANLIADAAGNLYGTTPGGGEHGVGAVFKLSPGSEGTWIESVIYSFPYNFHGNSTDGAYPTGSLVLHPAGNLYGTTTFGGYTDSGDCNAGCGVVFELTPLAGGKWLETILYRFRGYNNRDGNSPGGALLFDSSGNLYGTTEGGGSSSYYGTAFKLAPTSRGDWTESILYSFSGGTDGAYPGASLTFDRGGNLYGTTPEGGDLSCSGRNNFGCGVVFELTPEANGNWKEIVLHSFQYPVYLSFSSSPNLVVDSRGALYGTTSNGGPNFGSVFRLRRNSKEKWTYETLYKFAGGSDGSYPLAGLMLDAVGRLYGTTEFGGVISGKTPCPYQVGCGIIFQLTPHSGAAWTERVLHKFSGGKDGAEPLASLISDQKGNLYATASAGGGGGCDYLAVGCGAVLKLSPITGGKWTADPLYRFGASDGFDPLSTLIADGAGNFYGTTNAGGQGPGYFEGNSGQDCPYGCGTVFKLSRTSNGDWSRSLLYSFTGINGDGAFPWGNLTFDDAGNLYGTTEWGGAYGWGTVVELMPSSGGRWKEMVIYSFTGSSDGSRPVAGLVFDAGGSLYGTTSVGGNNPACSRGCGTVFRLSPSGRGWKETVLYSFGGANGDGAIPTASLILDAMGNLYGTTSLGGVGCQAGGCGTAFKLSPTPGSGWEETVLHAFTDTNGDGVYPQGNLTRDDAGNLYGTTYEGGTASHCGIGFTGCGTIFRLTRQAGGAWAENILYNFGSYAGDAKFPGAGLTFDVAGNLYGTSAGGTKGWGTVFKLTSSSGGTWTESITHDFAGYPFDGGLPAANVSFDAGGNLYGTTSVGGTGGGGSFGGYENFGGIVFEITP
jgi:uncharacterized repeat protein (TIGR03803 family)